MKLKQIFFTTQVVLATFLSAFGQPVIVSQPQNQTNAQGSTAIFSVVASGMSPLTYQWRGYTSSTIFANLPDATNDTLTLTNVQPSEANFRYAVVVSDVGGSVTSTLARLVVILPPTISTQPR